VLVVAGGVTILATTWLFLMFRGGEVTGRQLSRSTLLYLLFAGASLIR
jgi:cation:H+ antiporter